MKVGIFPFLSHKWHFSVDCLVVLSSLSNI
jgi:hypothetical protein